MASVLELTMLFIQLIKCIHIVAVLGLFGTALFCLVQLGSRRFARGNARARERLGRANRYLLALALVALLSGTLLVHPKQYTLHTPWIQAAYLYLLILGVSIGLMLKYRRQLAAHRGLALLSYLALIAILVLFVYDAVTKTTFLF